MSEAKAIVKTQPKRKAIPRWREHYDNSMAILDDNIRRVERMRDALREDRRELGIE